MPALDRNSSGDKPVALALTVHQPDDGLQALAERAVPALSVRYGAVVAVCSDDTHKPLLTLLQRCGVWIEREARSPGGFQGLGHTKRETLRLGLATGAPHVHVCDFDRAIHWAVHHPAELDEVVAEAGRFDYLVLGRTARAWDSHPAYQRQTEWLFNHVYQLVTGQSWDIGAGSRVVSQSAGTILLARSVEPSVGIDAEWPLLVQAEPGLCAGYRACDGLEFETADRCTAEIEASGGYEAWLRQIESDPGRWAFRLRVAMLIAEAALRLVDARGGTACAT